MENKQNKSKGIDTIQIYDEYIFLFANKKNKNKTKGYIV